MHAAKSDSAVWCIPWRLAPRCNAHREVFWEISNTWLRGMMLVVKLTPPHQAVILNPAGGQTHPSPPKAHSPHLLVVKLTPPRQAVILHTCWWPNSPLSAQGSSSTPAGGQTHPSPPSGHPQPLLVAKLTHLRPGVILNPCWWSNLVKLTFPRHAVILNPCWWPNSPLPTWRSTSPLNLAIGVS